MSSLPWAESQMTINAIESAIQTIQAIEHNSALYDEANFVSRAEAIDYLEFNVIDRIEGLLQNGDLLDELSVLQMSAANVVRQLEEVDAALFRRLRAEIRAGGYAGKAFTDLIDFYIGSIANRPVANRPVASSHSEPNGQGYDNLDLFVNGLLLYETLPVETKEREAEMVYYQQTPARIILEMAERACLTEKDVFYDLGSGLGHVPILVHLLSGARAKGIECEPAYWAYARACADDLHLSGVEFVNGDARSAAYADGTVFFLYTPFVGAMLAEVLEKLWVISKQRTIRIFTYGPCTQQVARQGWLQSVLPAADTIYQLGEFQSKL